ncbi:MAG: 4-(cytidine 5'-diphospho)-2-C-methyl-D-erythritol kinase [Thermodesulfobacteriota bacterium]
MKKLRVRAPAKVNLYLRLLGTRPDGYHEIETLFQAIDLYDELIIRESPGEARLEVPGHPDLQGTDNLVMKALRLLESATGERLGVEITLDKKVPIAGGLGGGSSDAAAALAGLRTLHDLALTDGELARIGATLGADIPFFLTGGSAIGEGIGDRLTPTDIPMDYEIVLVNPGFPVSTAAIYREFDMALTQVSPHGRLKGLLQDAREVRRLLHNDLQSVAEKCYPEILDVRRTLCDCGLPDCLMSGSGPSVFGISDGKAAALAEVRKRSGGRWLVFVVRPVSHGVVLD